MSEYKQKISKWLLWVTVTSAAILLICPFVLYHMRQRAAYERTLLELEAAGYPTTVEQLKTLCVLPEGEDNAADIFLKANSAFIVPDDQQQQWLPFQGNYVIEDGQPLPLQVLDSIRQSIDNNARCLELLDRAAQIEHCLFSVEFEGYATNQEDVSYLTDCSYLVADRNILLAHSGQTERLFNSIQTGLAIMRAKSAIPTLSEYLMANRQELCITASIEYSLNNVSFSGEQLTSLQNQLRQLSQSDHLLSALNAEIVFAIDSKEKLVIRERMKKLSGFRDKATGFLYCLSGKPHKDYAFILNLYRQSIETAKLPFHQQLDNVEKLDTAMDSYKYHWKIIPNQCWPTLWVFNREIYNLNRLRCAETAMAVERYRLKYGELPGSLEALVPEFMDAVRLDPYDGKPIRYNMLENGGYRLYTIGKDGIDNGGESKPFGADGYDFPFTVRRSNSNDQ